MSNNIVISGGQETEEGVNLRLYNPDTNIIKWKPIKFNNYFYISSKDFIDKEDEFNKKWKNNIENIEIGNKFTKITLNNNLMRWKIKTWCEHETIQTFEADIDASKRFFIDTSNIKLNSEHSNVLFFDIETQDNEDIITDDYDCVIANEAILSFAAYDKNGNSWFFINKNKDNPIEGEKELLLEIQNLIENYCIISGYYSDKFDVPFIEQRCKFHNINFDIKTIQHIDFLESIKKNTYSEMESYSLDSVSQHYVGIPKIEVKKGGGNIEKLWRENPSLLEKYNLRDAQLLLFLNYGKNDFNGLHLLEIHMMQSNLCKCPVTDTMLSSKSNDYLLLNGANKKNVICPTKPPSKIVELRKDMHQIGGGLCRDYLHGVFNNAIVRDFQSHYPLSAILTFNISNETYRGTVAIKSDSESLKIYKGNKKNVKMFETQEKLDQYVKDNDLIITPKNFNTTKKGKTFHPHRLYSNKSMGGIPKIVQGLVLERNKTKYTMFQYKETNPSKYFALNIYQLALKVQVNAIYGFLALTASRFFNWDMADSITTTCRSISQNLIDFTKTLNWVPIFSDTDSAIFYVPKNIEKPSIEEMNKLFNDHISEMMKNHPNKVLDVEGKNYWIKFEHEKTFKRLLYVCRKNYAFLNDDGTIGVKGLQYKKVGTNPLAKLLQKEFVKDILRDNVDLDKTKQELIKWRKKTLDGDLEEEHLIFVKGFTKSFKSYEGQVIDSKTKKPKIKKDGTIQMKSIPAHIVLAKTLPNLFVGDKINYIVNSSTPRNIAISVEEYRKNQIYDTNYYWNLIVKPIKAIIRVYKPQLIKEWEDILSVPKPKKIKITENMLNNWFVDIEKYLKEKKDG